MGLDRPEKTTPLFVDLDLSTELLKCSHGEFLKLPRVERKKLRLYYHVRVQKDKLMETERKMRSGEKIDG